MPLLSRLLRKLGYVRMEPREAPGKPTAVRQDTNPAAELPPLDITPWSAKRLASIFNRCNQLPDARSIADARAARMVLSKFWLSAPVDQLETLYRSGIGSAYRVMLAGRLPSEPMDRDEENWRQTLSRHLIDAFGAHETTNVLLAVMPFYDRNGMRVVDPLRQIPTWLLPDYAERCDPALLSLLTNAGSAPGPSRLLQAPGSDSAPPQAAMMLDSPILRTDTEFPPLPTLAEKQGPDCMTLIQDQAFLGRVSGLINLYAIDSNDADLKQDLAQQRRQIAQIWMDVQTDQLEALYRTAFGQLTQNLIASGFWREPVNSGEDLVRQQLAAIVSAMQHPRSLNAFMAALLYVSPKSVSVNSSQLLPPWLIQELKLLADRTPAG